MTTLILDRRKLSLDYEGDCLFVRGEGMPVKTVPLRQVQRLICLHGVSLTTSLLGQLRSRGIDFVVLNSRYPERSFSMPADSYRGAMRRVRQCQLFSDGDYCLQLAQRIVSQKLLQQQIVARRYVDTESAGQLNNPLASLVRLRQQCRAAENIASLRGIEGSAAAQSTKFYTSLYSSEWGFTRRERRPPHDPVNALLSLSYTLLYRDGANSVQSIGLDPWLGFYHEPLQGRYSLVCDLMEPLRPAVEQFVYQILVAENELDRRHFSNTSTGCFLGKQGRAQFFPLYEEAALPWRRQIQRYSRWLLKNIEAASDMLSDAA